MQGENTDNESGQNNPQALPGAVITPGSTGVPTPPINPADTLPSSVTAEALQPSQTDPNLAPVINDQQGSPAATPHQSVEQVDDNAIGWIGPQFISHDKSQQWLLMFVIGAIVIGAIIELITKDFLSAITIALAIVVLGAYSYRKPKNINYTLTEDSVIIDNRSYAYEQFRSFTAVPEGPYMSVTFFPLKRFSPLVGLYYMGKDEEMILGYLADRLPIQEPKSDPIDNLMRRIKF